MQSNAFLQATKEIDLLLLGILVNIVVSIFIEKSSISSILKRVNLLA